MKQLVALIVLVSFTMVGCYSTYVIPREELAKLQTAEETTSVTVNDVRGSPIQVSDDTHLFVRSKGGKRYPITPFNFQMTESQLVASDRDYILDLNGLEDRAEVDHASTWKTATLITIGALAVAGLVTLTVLTAGKKSQGD